MIAVASAQYYSYGSQYPGNYYGYSNSYAYPSYSSYGYGNGHHGYNGYGYGSRYPYYGSSYYYAK